MPTPSKFTAETRTKLIQALKVGASKRTAAAIASVDEAQVRRWIAKGKESEEGTRYREFYLEVQEAEAHPRLRALGVIYKELPDNPGLAWKFIERREHGYEPPVLSMPTLQPGPIVIQLSLSDGAPIALAETVIEVEGIEQDDATTPALPEPTPITSA